MTELKGEIRMDIEAPLLGTMKVTLDARDLATLAEAMLPYLQRLGVVVRYRVQAQGSEGAAMTSGRDIQEQ